jgi:hypothetical protein
MREADDLTTFMCWMSWKSGSLNLLEPSGPHRACNRMTLPFSRAIHQHCISFSHQRYRNHVNPFRDSLREWDICYSEIYATVRYMLQWDICYSEIYATVRYMLVRYMLQWDVCYSEIYATVRYMLQWDICYSEIYATDPKGFLMKFRQSNTRNAGKQLSWWHNVKTVTDSSADGTAHKYSGSHTFSLNFNELVSLHSSYLLMFPPLNLSPDKVPITDTHEIRRKMFYFPSK